MPKIRECVKKMQAYVPGEAAIDPSCVKLNQNENRYPPSAKALAAMSAAISTVALYPDSSSTILREAAAKTYGVSPDEVMATNGSDEMLRLLFQACCDPGDQALAFYPSYTYYSTLADMHAVTLRHIDFEGEYAIPRNIDVENARLVFLPNPNAPTGTVFPESEVRRLLEAAPGSMVVVDEAYADYADSSVIRLVKEYANLAVVRTFSKGYALAGLRAGLGFARADFLAEVEKIRDYYNVDRVAQAGATAALLDTEWLADTARKIIATRARTAKAIAKLGLKVYDSGANFILVRCPSPEQAQKIQAGLRQRNVLVRYFRNRGISDCLRVSIGTDPDMDAFLTALESVLREG